MTENPYRSPNTTDRSLHLRPIISWALFGALSLSAMSYIFAPGFPIVHLRPSTSTFSATDAFMLAVWSAGIMGVLGAVMGGAIGWVIASLMRHSDLADGTSGSHDIVQEYPYRPGWLMIILSFLFFGVMAGFMGYRAWTNDSGTVVLRGIELSESDATVFYWIVSGVGAGFVVIAFLMTLVRLFVIQRIAVTAGGLLVPASRFSSRETFIPFDEITHVKNKDVGRQHFFTVYHSEGKIEITASLLPSMADFEAIQSFVRQKLSS